MKKFVQKKNETWNNCISKSEAGGFKVIFSVSGNDIYSYLKYGQVYIVFKEFLKQKHKVEYTSAATIAVLPEAEDVDIAIKESDLRIDVFGQVDLVDSLLMQQIALCELYTRALL